MCFFFFFFFSQDFKRSDNEEAGKQVAVNVNFTAGGRW